MRFIRQTRLPGSPSDVIAEDSPVREVIEAAIEQSAQADGRPVTIYVSPDRSSAIFENVLWNEYAVDCDPQSQCWGEDEDGRSWTLLISGGINPHRDESVVDERRVTDSGIDQLRQEMIDHADDLEYVTAHHWGERIERPFPDEPETTDHSVSALRHLYLFFPVLEDSGFELPRQRTYDPDWDERRTYRLASEAIREQLLNASLDQLRGYKRHYDTWLKRAEEMPRGEEARFISSKLSTPWRRR